MTPEKTRLESVSVSIRIPQDTYDVLGNIAKTKYVPLSTLLRIWVLERIVEENKITGAEQHAKQD